MKVRNLLLLVPLTLVIAVTTAFAQSPTVRAEVERMVLDIQSGTRLQRTLGAIAVRHMVARQPSFTLFNRTTPRWWQQTLQPSVPRLVLMLRDRSGLEWVDQNGVTEQTTTPGQEARLALLALERPAVAPLIEVLDRPDVAKKAAEVLRQLTQGGPATDDKASWQSWWSDHQQRPLPNERGRWWQVLLALLLLGAGVTLVIWQLRRSGGRAASPLTAGLKPGPGAR